MGWKQDMVGDAFVWCSMLLKLKPESKWIYEKWMRLSSECSISLLYFIRSVCLCVCGGGWWKPENKVRPGTKEEYAFNGGKNVMSSVIHFDGRGFVAIIIVGFLWDSVDKLRWMSTIFFSIKDWNGKTHCNGDKEMDSKKKERPMGEKKWLIIQA